MCITPARADGPEEITSDDAGTSGRPEIHGKPPDLLDGIKIRQFRNCVAGGKIKDYDFYTGSVEGKDRCLGSFKLTVSIFLIRQ